MFESIIQLLVNVGFGGAVVGALILFLRHLITRSLPDITNAFREEMREERAQRAREHRRVLRAVQRHHEVILDRLDFGMRELIMELSGLRPARASSEKQPPPGPPAGPGGQP